MGASSVLRNKTYLEKEEIEKICSKNKYINSVFARAKNEDGLLTIKELNTITDGLLCHKILKKIIQICGSKKDKLTYDDFCYFYALLNTSSFDAKFNFLLDFIFMKHYNLSKEKYINKCKKYFKDSKSLTNIFLDEDLLQKVSNYNRDNIYSYIENNSKKKLEDYPLYINKTYLNINLNIQNENDNYEKNTNTEKNENNENTLILMNNYSKEHSKTSINSVNIAIIKKQQYDSLEGEFRNIEKMNDGIFPISLFEDMLREINVDDSLIELIGNYLRKKTKKNFFNFNLFKEILSLLTSDETHQKKIYKDISKGIFILASYPNNYIDKKTLITLFKNEKNIEKKLEKFERDKPFELSQFLELYYYKNDIFDESLEHIQYLKYIFFKEKIRDDRSIEKKCVRILLKDKSMEDYILERLQYDNSFYLIDIEFWNKWNELTSEPMDEINNNKLRKLRINTKSFSDNQGKILEGHIFPKDYVILSKTIYNLFNYWYGPPLGLNIIRNKIYLEDETNNINQIKKRNKNDEFIFSGVERKTNKEFELEINPIFLEFYYFMSLFQNSNNSMGEMSRKLRRIYKEEGGSSTCFSRKTKFFEIAKKHKNNLNMNINNIRFIVYYNYNLQYAEMSESLEQFGIKNKALILIDEKINNVWSSEKIKKEDNNKYTDENEDNFVGLYNIGNTCYMNSILQIFLNIEEIKTIFIKQKEENKDFLSFILNLENKEIMKVASKKGFLIVELINLLKEKWLF